ncbi:MAG: single-stranded-DNA-specific exonuclease [Chloroflexota bacterium]|nr:single-stranded-DNA-specific exonuclease [Chloroflexota bacterium]
MHWLDPQPVSASPEISAAYSGSILLAEQLARRDIRSREQAHAYLDPLAYTPASPFDFPDMPQAVERVQAAIRQNQTIGIWGDFDVDGQTSTALLVDGLRRAGADVRYHVPNRARESHGIRLPFLKEFMRGKLDLLITCDTGISELESLTYAAGQGLDVILTDHHTPPETLPPALALLNPRLLPDDNPMQDMAGVGTAYQLVRALYETQGHAKDADAFLDLVALGTVADLADLSRENRYYVQRGLELMRSDLRPALQALLASADYRGGGINESLIGFTIGPRMNAAGRLDDANIVVEFLLSHDEAFLQAVAAQLEDLNSQRKLAVEGVYQSARDMLAQDPALGRYAALVLAKAGWERGVVGIAASHLSEDYNKPVILLNLEGDSAAGSVRSVEGINIIRAIRENGAYLRSYGGHPMAAGLSLSADQLQPFRAALSRSVAQAAEGLPAEKQLQIDAYLPLSNLTHALIGEIDQLAPFGSGNPPPVLVSRNLTVENNYPLGRNELHRKLIVRDEQGERREVLWWNARDQALPQGKLDLAYYLRLNRYQGQESVVLEWIDAREALSPAAAPKLPLFTAAYEDWRQAEKLPARLQALSAQDTVLFFAEGIQPPADLPVSNRLQLEAAETLVLLTPPPDLATLQRVLRQAAAQRVIFAHLGQPDDSPDSFLKRLSGLLRYTLTHYNGQTSLERLAAALGQTSTVVELGLALWQAHGDILAQITEDGDCLLEKNTHTAQPSPEELERIARQLDQALSENAAFRSFYRRAEPEFLLRKA